MRPVECEDSIECIVWSRRPRRGRQRDRSGGGMNAVTAELLSRFSHGIRIFHARAARRGRFRRRIGAARVIGGVGQDAQSPAREYSREEKGQNADDKQCAFAHLFNITQARSSNSRVCASTSQQPSRYSTTRDRAPWCCGRPARRESRRVCSWRQPVHTPKDQLMRCFANPCAQ